MGNLHRISLKASNLAATVWGYWQNIFHWRGIILELCQEVDYERDRAEAATRRAEELRAEVMMLRKELAAERARLAQAKKGTLQLLTFIQRSQRLNVPIEPNSIRAELYRAQSR